MSKREWRFADETLTTVIQNGRGGRAKGRKKENEMNRTEARFAQQLELRRQVGEIVWWTFEGLTFRIGERCFYTPDFDIMLSSCELQCIDTKGTQTKTSKSGRIYETDYTEDDARVKLAACASLYPIAFYIAFEDATGNWITRQVGA
jgi:hypothetical protein